VADKATELQAQVVQQQIVQETARAQEIEKTAQVKVQEAEGQRRQMELEATVINTANAERQRMETLAAAERQRLSLEAEGHATALRSQASAEAEAIRIRGLAEAEVIRAKGEAEAEAMRVKAAAYHEYNQAAVLDKVISNLPEMVRALAEPLSKVDKISIVSTGSGANGNLGASRVTGDMVNILAQTPAILEALTGVRMADLFARVPGMTVESDGATANGAATGASKGDQPTQPDAAASDADASAPTSQPTDVAEPVTASDTPAEVTANVGASGLNGAAPTGARGPRRQRAR
jgi:flotillin